MFHRLTWLNYNKKKEQKQMEKTLISSIPSYSSIAILIPDSLEIVVTVLGRNTRRRSPLVRNSGLGNKCRCNILENTIQHFLVCC